MTHQRVIDIPGLRATALFSDSEEGPVEAGLLQMMKEQGYGDELMTDIGHPKPPSETNLGKDSTPAPDVAAVQEAALQKEELDTDE